MTDTSQAIFNDPMSVFAFLATLVAVIFWVSGVKRFEKFFEYVPPVIFVYFLPMFATTLGITPISSSAYEFTTRYFLPLALFLLMISIDLKSVAKLGPVALFMVTAGTVGIIVGGPVALFVFQGALPEDSWKGFAALSGSWIGGTANMVAVAESVDTPESAFGPIIVVDTVVGYGWMGVLLFFSVWQKRDERPTGRAGSGPPSHHGEGRGVPDWDRDGCCRPFGGPGGKDPATGGPHYHQRHYMGRPDRGDRRAAPLVHTSEGV
jgi:uncharacterized membrane protein